MCRRTCVWLLGCLALELCASTAPVSAQSANDGFNPDPSGYVCDVALQADGKVLVGGGFSMIAGHQQQLFARLNPDGSLDIDFFPNVDSSVLSIYVQADNKILIGGAFTHVNSVARTDLARLNPDGSLDMSFNPAPIDNSGQVDSIAVQPDGKVLIVGVFSGVGGQPHEGIARLNPDGSLDTGFTDSGANASMTSVVLQADGKVVVGGPFTGFASAPNITYLARLNPDGTVDTSFNLDVDNIVYALGRQPDGKLLVAGAFTHVFGQGRTHIARLNADGTFDGSFAPPTFDGTTVVSLAIQSDGKLPVHGDFTQIGVQPRSFIARLNADGSLDDGFNPGVSQSLGGCPEEFAVQSDGKLLFGGQFTQIGGQAINNLARLYPDGSVEIAFDPDAGAEVQSLAVQPDGKVLAGGAFIDVGGTSINHLARLNPDGSLDAGFNPNVNGSVISLVDQADGSVLLGGNFTQVGLQARSNLARVDAGGVIDIGFNPGVSGTVSGGTVNSIVEQSDGKMLIGGSFEEVGGQQRLSLARLDSGGTIDIGFNPGVVGTVYSIAVQGDGAIVIGGDFTEVANTARSAIARIDAGGSLDIGFNPGVSGTVSSLAVQADSKLLVGGNFTNVGGEARGSIARLNSDATIDIGFNPGVTGSVNNLTLQTDGGILVGGDFTVIAGQAMNNVARLHGDGTIDIGFNPGADSTVDGIAVQPDGKTIAGGLFGMIGGAVRNCLARLSTPESAQQSLQASPGSASWLRSGSMPELQRAWFERSSDGVSWSPLGEAQRIAGGWALTGLNLPLGQSVYLRARGVARGGLYDGSGSLLEFVQQVFIEDAIFGDGFDG